MVRWTLGVLVRAENVGVRVGQRLPAAVDRAREPRGLLARLLVERELLERPDVDLERLGRVEELLLEELGETVVGGQARLGSLGVGELRLVDRGELLPLAHRAVERLEDVPDLGLLRAAREQGLERLERRLVLRGRADDVAIGRDRGVEIAELGLLHLAEPVLQLEDLVGGLRDLGLAREDGRELGPALGHRVEAVERADGREVLGVGVGDAPVARDGAVDVFELDLEDLRVAQPELDEAVFVVAAVELVELRVVELASPAASG